MTTVHATAADWATYIGGTPPANLTQLLRRASLDVDGELLTAMYDDLDEGIAEVLAEATCEQAAHLKSQGAADGLSSGYSNVSIGSVSLARRPGDDATRGTFSSRAFQILQTAGLTGVAPYTG
jgi:hypothetical protein